MSLCRIIRTVVFSWLALAPFAHLAAGERPPAARLLPDTTVAMVTVPDVPLLRERFLTSAMGRLSQDPQLQPLLAKLYTSLGEIVDEAKDRVGLSLPEMVALLQGELTVAAIPSGKRLTTVAIVEVKDQVLDARRALVKIDEAFGRLGGVRSEERIGDLTLVAHRKEGVTNLSPAYFEYEGAIVFGSDAEVVKKILSGMSGEPIETLADNFDYATIVNRCHHEKETTPQIRWFVDPIRFIESQASGGAAMVVAMLPALGLDGIAGVGGTLAYDAGQYDDINHVHLLLDTPRRAIVDMIALTPVEMNAEKWVPADAATYMTLRADLSETFAKVSKLYDSFQTKGAFSEMLSDRVLGPTGIDLEKDVIPYLDGRITTLKRIARPVTFGSQQQLWAVKLTESAPIERVLATVAEKFANTMTAKEYAGRKYYRLTLPEPPPRPERPDGPRRRRGPPMPEPCFAVIEGYLIATDREALLEKVILTLSQGQSLGDELDFKLVVSRIDREAGETKPTLFAFDRPAEGLRYLYDLAGSDDARDGLRRAGEARRVFRSVSEALEAHPLPPFEVLERYLAPGGGFLVDDGSGFHYSSFGLRRKTE